MNRHWLVILLICYSISNLLYANDTLIQKEVGGNIYKLAISDKIVLENEILQLDYYKDFYTVSVDYQFRNNGEDCNIEIGFPELQFLNYSKEIDFVYGIEDYETWVNGDKVSTEIVDANIDIGIKNQIIKKIFKKNVHFLGQSQTNIRVSYRSRYRYNFPFTFISEYLLGTAISWNGIKNLKVIFVLHDDAIYLALLPYFDPITNIRDRQILSRHADNLRILEYRFEDPSLFLDTRMITEIIKETDTDIFGFVDYSYSFDDHLISKQEFTMLTINQLRLVRNLIYAWHGYVFSNKELNEYFSKFEWYKEKKASIFSESTFSETEKANLRLITQIESELKK